MSLLAAFADGNRQEQERAAIKRIAEGFSADESLRLQSLYQDVLMKRVSIAPAASALASQESRQLAYEMAVCVCDADGTQTEAERRFLEEVRVTLTLPSPEQQSSLEPPMNSQWLRLPPAAPPLQRPCPPLCLRTPPISTAPSSMRRSSMAPLNCLCRRRHSPPATERRWSVWWSRPPRHRELLQVAETSSSA